MTTPTHEHFAGDIAASYEQHFVPQIPAPLADRTLARAEVRPGERVLDVACGTGIVARVVADHLGPDANVIGVDLSPDMLAHAAAVATASGVRVDWRQGDAADLPVDTDSIDVALFQLGLMLVGDRPAAVRELRRVLRPGGRVVINVPGAVQPFNEALADTLARRINPDLAGFVAAVFSMGDPTEVAELLTDAGFSDVSSTAEPITIHMPPPAEYLWGYVSSTPLSLFLKDAPVEARQLVEKDLVEAWQPFVEGDGMAYEQPIVWATATA